MTKLKYNKGYLYLNKEDIKSFQTEERKCTFVMNDMSERKIEFSSREQMRSQLKKVYS